MVQEFIDAILAQREPAVTGEDGRFALAVTLAGYQSDQLGEAILFAKTQRPFLCYHQQGSGKIRLLL